MQTSVRLTKYLLALIALAVLTAACGSGDDGTAEAATGDTGPAATQTATETDSASAFPVTVEHVWGSTTIDEEPERVVTLGLTDADPVLAVGVTPVAVSSYGFIDGGLGPWATPLVDGEAPEWLTGELNLEQIAALRPDLIIAVNVGFDETVYEQLAGIAPTVGRPVGTEAYKIPRDDGTRLISEALGRPERGEEVIEEANAAYEQAKADHPEFQGKTGVAALPYDGKYGAYTPTDTRGQVMIQLGFELPPQLAELEDDEKFSIEVSQEQAALLDADVLVMIADTTDLRDFVDNDAVLQATAVAQEGRMIIVDSDTRGAMTYNTVLSVPYALDALVPQLADAIAELDSTD